MTAATVPSASQPIDRRRQLVHRGSSFGVPGHADAEHEGVAEPEGQAGEKADLGDVDRAKRVVRINPETNRAAGEHGRTDVVADRIAREARQRGDPVGHVLLADRPQREEIIECQRTERADHAQRGKRNAMRRYFGQRRQDHAGIDALEGADQRRDREGDDQEARGDPEPSPADPFLEATPERGQQSMHSSSRQGGNMLQASSKQSSATPPIVPERKPIRQKHPVVQSLDNASFDPGSVRPSHALHRPCGAGIEVLDSGLDGLGCVPAAVPRRTMLRCSAAFSSSAGTTARSAG